MATDSILQGVVVVDFTHIFAGPFCTQLLADAGATVLKIEPPGGEYTRTRGPRRELPDGRSVSTWYASLNSGKHRIELDLKSAPDLTLANQAVLAADIAIENFSTGALTRLGVDFEKLRAQKDSLITCSISLRGAAGPHDGINRAGLSLVAEAESTLMATQRDTDGNAIPFGFALGDLTTGLTAYAGLVTALLAREHTGRGRHLTISMVASLLALNGPGLARAQVPTPTTPADGMPAAMGLFPAADGQVAIAVNSDRLFQRFCIAAGLAYLLDDPLLVSAQTRDVAKDRVDAVISGWTSNHHRSQIIDVLTTAGVPCGLVAEPEDFLTDEHELAGFLREVEDGLGGRFRLPANPFGIEPAGAVGPLQGGRQLLLDLVGARL